MRDDLVYTRWYYVGEDTLYRALIGTLDLDSDILDWLEDKARELEAEMKLPEGFFHSVEVADWDDYTGQVMLNFYTDTSILDEYRIDEEEPSWYLPIIHINEYTEGLWDFAIEIDLTVPCVRILSYEPNTGKVWSISSCDDITVLNEIQDLLETYSTLDKKQIELVLELLKIVEYEERK